MCASTLPFESPNISPPSLATPSSCELQCGKQVSHKRKFTPEEDLKIKNLVEHHGIKSWKYIAEHMEGRTVRQIRERYCNYLQPHLQMKPWTDEEDNLLTQKFSELGSRWVEIAVFFPGRTDVHLKNRMKLLLRRLNRISSLNIPMVSKNIHPFILPKIEKRPRKLHEEHTIIQAKTTEIVAEQNKQDNEDSSFEFLDDSLMNFDYFTEYQSFAF